MKKKGKKVEGKKEGGKEEDQNKEPNRKIKCSLCSYYHLCLVKVAEEGRIPLESPKGDSSSNLPSTVLHGPFPLTSAHSFIPPSKLGVSKVSLTDWLSHCNIQKVTYFRTWNSAKASLFSLLHGSLVHNASKPHQYEVSDLEKKWREANL